MRKTLLLLAGAVLLAGSAAAQRSEYLDVLRITVRPEKRTEFEAAIKRMAQANRQNNGDHWTAISTEYGDNNTITLVTGRLNYSDIDRGFEMFEGAVKKAAGGQAGFDKLMQAYESTITRSRGEIRRVRWDLCVNIPEPEAFMKVVATSRWVRTSRVEVRPGRSLDYENLLKNVKAAVEKSSFKKPVHIAQAADGTSGPAYYVSMFGAKLGDFDDIPKLSEMLGEEGFATYLKTVAEVVVSSESALGRFLPELSVVPKEFAAAAPEFWNPKPAPAPMAKPKPKAP
jgi:hypothetical protein